MSLHFEQPQWLLLILLAVPVAVVAMRWFVGMSPARRWSAVVTRILLISLIAGMLAGASSVRRTERVAVVAVLDVSGSVQRFADFGRTPEGREVRLADAAREFLRQAVRQRGADDLLGIVVFDGSARVVAAPTRVDALDRAFDPPQVEGTNIEDAIRLAAAMFPPDAARKIVLFSDGNETRGRALEAARELAGPAALARAASEGEASPARGFGGAGGVVIDVVPIPYNLTREVVVESVDAPPQAPGGSVVTVRVVLESTGRAAGTLLLTREGEPIDIDPDVPGYGRRITLQRGRTVETIQVRLDGGRVHRFEAFFEPDQVRFADGSVGYDGDTVLTNNRGQAVTLTPGQGTVLVVDGVSGGNPQGPGATLGATLAASGLQVETVPPEGMPRDLLSLQGYDLVVLQSVAADEIPLATHELLVSYVTQLGGGLAMVGGPGSFGAGGWSGTALEPILPVRLDLPERLVMPSAAIMIVLDNSGSMNLTVMGSSRTQQQIANEGAALAIENLDRGDLVGVITFNSWHQTVVPLSPNDDPSRTASIVRSITPGGGTNIPPALEEAYRQLKDARAAVKHAIVLTDGVSMNKEVLPGLAARMAEDGIVVSTIAVGDDADTSVLAVMADQGGGTFYRVTDPNLLPRVFLRAVRVVRTPMIREAPFQPRLLPTGSPIIEGLSQPPRLGGVVLTQPRAEPTVTYAMEAEPGEPLLAHWNAGLGRVAAFTSDAHGQWSSDWLRWPGYSRMWTQLARQISRPQADRRAELTTELSGDELRIRFDAIDDDGRPQDLLTVPGSVYAPDGGKIPVQLAQTGPGVYEGAVPAAESGTYVVLLTPRQGDAPLAPVIGGASRATGLEYRRLRSNITLLRQIADATGGSLLDLGTARDVNLFDRSLVRPSEAVTPLWRTLLLWALLVMLLDVGTRRIAWDRLVSRRFGADVRKQMAETLRDRSEQASRTLGQLRGRPREEAAQAAALASAKLSAEDAKRIVQEQAQRRRAERAARQQAVGGGPAQTPSAPAPQTPSQPQTTGAPGADAPVAEGEQSGAAGLLAAKRRARERFEKGE